MAAKICADCHHFQGYSELCTTPERKSFSLIYGWLQKSLGCQQARTRGDDCGLSAKWFVAKFDHP